jgi:hypothetical protein
LEQNKLKEEWLEEFEQEIMADDIDPYIRLWSTITCTQNLSYEYIVKHQDVIDWKLLIKKNLSKKILNAFLHKFDWTDICKYQKLDEFDIRKYSNYVLWDDISSYKNLSINFVLEFKDKLDWNKISFAYKFNEEQFKQVEHLVIKTNNLLYMNVNEIKSTLPPNAIIVDDKYVVGYMDFTSFNPVIYCFNENEHLEIQWSNELISKEFESDCYNYKISDCTETYGFVCYNTIKEAVTCSFNCGFISEHIIKVLIPIEFAKYYKSYGVYDVYNTKKIIIVNEVFYNCE